MELTVGAYNPYSEISYSRPMSYSVPNQAPYSAAYTNSVKQASPDTLVNPVSYPNATLETGRVGGKAAVETAKSFNDIAMTFEGTNTGYDISGNASSYSLIGQNIDLYA